jgi:hypothetical protein
MVFVNWLKKWKWPILIGGSFIFLFVVAFFLSLWNVEQDMVSSVHVVADDVKQTSNNKMPDKITETVEFNDVQVYTKLAPTFMIFLPIIIIMILISVLELFNF